MSLAIVAFANVALLYDKSNIKMCQFDPIRGTKYFWQQNEHFSGIKTGEMKNAQGTSGHSSSYRYAHGRRKVHKRIHVILAAQPGPNGRLSCLHSFKTF